jgi:ferrochelatase
MTAPVGVAWLNLGGPSSPGAVPDFLRRMLADPYVVPAPGPVRSLLARWVAWRRSPRVVGHYARIGGASPIEPLTRDQVEALAARLGEGAIVRYVFRHSPPFASEVVGEFAAAGVRRVVAFPAYPQWSGGTTGSAVEDLEAAASVAGMEVTVCGSFPVAEGYVSAIADGIRPLLAPGTHLVLTAHGLPMRTVRAGDPYVGEVERTAEAVRGALPDLPCSLAYQSRLGPVRWTEPYLVNEIRRLGAAGTASVVVAPLSFVCENLETRYELDLELAELARSVGIVRYRRAPAPGCHASFIDDVARMVREAALAAGWEAPGAC